MEDYFAAKRRLFEMLPDDAPAVINVDDPRGASLVEIVRRPVTYGINKTADVSPGPLSFSLAGLDFDVRTPRGVVHVRSKLVGRPNVYNILAAVGDRLDARRADRRRSRTGCSGSPAFPADSRSSRARPTTSRSSSTTRTPTTRCGICSRPRDRWRHGG